MSSEYELRTATFAISAFLKDHLWSQQLTDMQYNDLNKAGILLRRSC